MSFSETFEFKFPEGVDIKHYGPSTDVIPKWALRKSGRSIFLRSNTGGTDHLEVTFDTPYNIVTIGIQTVLTNAVKITTTETAWPDGGVRF